MIYLPGRRPNYTQTARQFHSATPVSVRMVANLPGKRRPLGWRMLRLSCGAMTPKEDRSIPELYHLLSQGPLNSAFIFPDTCFITKAMPQSFWTLGRGRCVAFCEQTITELSSWIATPVCNNYLHSWLPRSLTACGRKEIPDDWLFRVHNALGAVGVDLVPFTVAIADTGRFSRYGADYYTNLLSCRKRQGIALARELQSRLCREPTESEVKRYINNKCHPRSFNLAFKGWKDHGKPNYSTDERLVVTALFTSILTGRESVLLTWDTDIFEQFFKLAHTLIADYACYRYAEVHYYNPAECPMYEMSIPSGSRFDSYGGNTVKHVILPEEQVDRLPPESYTPVHVYCVLLGNTSLEPKVSIAAFCLETEMVRMLEAKAQTGGKNTAHFPDKNMTVGTYRRDGKVGTMFVLAQESYVQFEGVCVSRSELQNILQSDPIVSHRYFLGN